MLFNNSVLVAIVHYLGIFLCLLHDKMNISLSKEGKKTQNLGLFTACRIFVNGLYVFKVNLNNFWQVKNCIHYKERKWHYIKS